MTVREELSDMQRSHKRGDVDLDYLKNVVTQYVSACKDDSQHQVLFPVIATLLQLSPGEITKVESRRASSTQAAGLLSSFF